MPPSECERKYRQCPPGDRNFKRSGWEAHFCVPKRPSTLRWSCAAGAFSDRHSAQECNRIPYSSYLGGRGVSSVPKGDHQALRGGLVHPLSCSFLPFGQRPLSAHSRHSGFEDLVQADQSRKSSRSLVNLPDQTILKALLELSETRFGSGGSASCPGCPPFRLGSWHGLDLAPLPFGVVAPGVFWPARCVS